MLDNMPVIALEEHYWDAEMAAHFPAGENKSHVADLLFEIGDVRLRAMDEAGIDVQVLSHGAPAAQKLPADIAVDLTKGVNDRLAEACAKYPTRFAGFAALPTAVPDQAALELERCVKQLGFKGAMIHGLTNGLFIDDKKFWPTSKWPKSSTSRSTCIRPFRMPRSPGTTTTIMRRNSRPVIRPAWGFTVETATAAIRLILSRVLEKHPKLQIILGHFGETLPFLLWRINQALSRPGQDRLNFRQQFCRNFHVTTSGNFSTPALICTMLELGIDRIMFLLDTLTWLIATA